jgi:AraC-like DNA-binding protein
VSKTPLYLNEEDPLMANFTSNRFHILDGLETFTSENETDYFPFHFHDYFCVSLITSGTELLENTERQFYAPSGSISVTQANEVHRNRSLNDAGYSYKTLYVNPDVLSFSNSGQPVAGLERVIVDPMLYSSLEHFFVEDRPDALQCIATIRQLSRYAVTSTQRDKYLNRFTAIDSIIDEHTAGPINSQWLARQFCMSEFHFIRSFKAFYGVTPQVYIMLQRLATAKKLIAAGMPLTQVAIKLGFTDSSHFTRNFKRFFGVAPGMYMRR